MFPNATQGFSLMELWCGTPLKIKTQCELTCLKSHTSRGKMLSSFKYSWLTWELWKWGFKATCQFIVDTKYNNVSYISKAESCAYRKPTGPNAIGWADQLRWKNGFPHPHVLHILPETSGKSPKKRPGSCPKMFQASTSTSSLTWMKVFLTSDHMKGGWDWMGSTGIWGFTGTWHLRLKTLNNAPWVAMITWSSYMFKVNKFQHQPIWLGRQLGRSQAILYPSSTLSFLLYIYMSSLLLLLLFLIIYYLSLMWYPDEWHGSALWQVFQNNSGSV